MTNKEFEENVLEKIVELNDALYYINRNYAAFDNAILVEIVKLLKNTAALINKLIENTESI